MKDISTKHAAAVVACLLIFASLWRLPLVSSPRIAFQMFFEIAVLGLFGFLLWQANKWIALFFVSAAVSAVYPNAGPISWVAFRTVFYVLLWYLFIVHFMNTQKTQAIMDALCIIALGNTLFLIAQGLGLCKETIGFDLVYKPIIGGGALPVGLMANRNEVSCLLAFCAPAFLSRRTWKYFLPAVALGLILARSSGGILAATVGVALYLCVRGKTVFGIGFICAVLVTIYYFSVDIQSSAVVNSFLARCLAWEHGWDVYKQHWIFGLGLGQWKVIFAKLKIHGVLYKTAHNELLQALFEMGIPFAVIAIGYALNIIRRLTKDALIPAMAVVIILINSLVHFGFHIATTMMIGVTWFAVLEITLRGENHGLETNLEKS